MAEIPPLVPRWLSIKRTLRFAANPIPILGHNVARYGKTYSFHIGGVKKGIASIEPKVIQHVLQRNNRNYRKSNIQAGVLKRYVGGGLLTSEGSYWLQQRRLIQPGFHRDKLASLIELMNKEIGTYLQQISSGPVDISQTMHDLAFNIVARALFSTGLNRERMMQMRSNLDTLQQFIIREVRQPYLVPWMRMSGQIRTHLKLSTATRQMNLDLIRQRLQTGERADDLLQMLLDARYEDGTAMNEQQLLDESLILFVAGHETSANALAWTLYLMGRHPHVVERIRTEIAALEGPPTFDDLLRLTYTRQVIDESLRMYPPAWVIDRVAVEDDEAAGYHIAAGSLMILYVYGTHHDESWWPSPDTFDPDRFRPDRKTSLPKYTYLPFGGGPRLCIGNNFALMEMQLILVQFLQNFSFRVLSKTVEIKPLITLRPARSIVLECKRRNKKGQSNG